MSKLQAVLDDRQGIISRPRSEGELPFRLYIRSEEVKKLVYDGLAGTATFTSVPAGELW